VRGSRYCCCFFGFPPFCKSELKKFVSAMFSPCDPTPTPTPNGVGDSKPMLVLVLPREATTLGDMKDCVELTLLLGDEVDFNGVTDCIFIGEVNLL